MIVHWESTSGQHKGLWMWSQSVLQYVHSVYGSFSETGFFYVESKNENIPNNSRIHIYMKVYKLCTCMPELKFFFTLFDFNLIQIEKAVNENINQITSIRNIILTHTQNIISIHTTNSNKIYLITINRGKELSYKNKVFLKFFLKFGMHTQISIFSL